MLTNLGLGKPVGWIRVKNESPNLEKLLLNLSLLKGTC